jgi:predicted small lipoprotein YifL
MKNKFLQFIILLASLGLASCGQQEADPVGTLSPAYRCFQVQLGQADDTDAGTRSLVSIDVENFQKAALFALDPQTGTVLTYAENAGDRSGEPVAILTTRQTFSWALPTGTAMDIYAIVNYGGLDMESFFRKNLQRNELESLKFSSKGPSELRTLESSGQGLPMAGIKRQVVLSSTSEGLTIRVRKLYAKYNLYFDLSRVEAEGWRVQAMHMIVENANTEVPYFTEHFRQTDASKLVEYDRATETDLDMLQEGGSDHAVTLYMLENCQGTKEGAESWKTVCKDLGFEAMKNCTYIDLSVKVQREGGEYQNLGYAIYLGKTDMRSDFDIERNLFKTIRIVLPGPSDPIPASRFFRFSGTETPTVAPGETIDLYFVTNLKESEIAASCIPQGFLTPVSTVYREGADGIATGYITLRAANDLEEGAKGVVTAGSSGLDATDQKTVTASWPVILDADCSQAPVYVAQQGYLQVVPTGTVVRTEAEIKSGSEGILRVDRTEWSGAIIRIGLSALSAGTGTVILHHFNSAGIEVGTQEVDVSVQAPLLRFNADTYQLSPDGAIVTGSLSYLRKDGLPFSAADKAKFSLPLIKSLLFPSTALPFEKGTPFAEASFTQTSDERLQALSLPLQVRLVHYQAAGHELDISAGAILDRLQYEAAPATGISGAAADVTVLNPFEGLAGQCLGTVENCLPVYHAFKRLENQSKDMHISPEEAFEITSYKEGNIFSINGSDASLNVPLPVSSSLSVVIDSPAEFSISFQGDHLTLTARETTRYEACGRYPIHGHIRLAESQELSPSFDMGYLEVYLIGAVAPYIRSIGYAYDVGGTLIPAGDASPIGNLAGGRVTFGEDTDFTEVCVRQMGLYREYSTATHNMYYQYEDVDAIGIQRFAKNGETAYLNSYRFAKGAWDPDTPFLEFAFGMIYMDGYHDHDIYAAAEECWRMTKATLSGCTRKGNLYHFTDAVDKDDNGYSYCAVVSLYGGEGYKRYDVFL